MDSNKTIQEVVVVEGYHDLARLKAIYPTIDVVITNGSEISESTLVELEQLQQQRGLILFLDPDYQGERIRALINKRVGSTKHAFLTKDQCISKNRKKIGVEHANDTAIIQALETVVTSSEMNKNNVTLQELRRLNLVGTSYAKKRRKQVTEKLGIGLCNGKSLLYKCHMFNITYTDLTDALEE